MFIDELSVRSAEHALALRKAELARQRAALRQHIADKLVQPTTLLSVALVGGMVGWRSGAPSDAAPSAADCECPAPQPPSLLSGALRSLVIAGLQIVASIASQEFLRSTADRGAEAAAGATADAVHESR